MSQKSTARLYLLQDKNVIQNCIYKFSVPCHTVFMSISFEKTIEINGHELTVTVEADGHVYNENYGADADGNRGEMRVQLDDLEMTIKDGHGKDITDKLQAKYKSIYDDLEEEAENELYEQHNEGEDYEPEDE